MSNIPEIYDTYIFDEFQFYDKEVVNRINELFNNEKMIYVAGLVSNFCGEPWGHIKDIIHLADRGIQTVFGCCEQCDRRNTGWFNARDSESQEAILLGDLYSPTCFKHHYIPT